MIVTNKHVSRRTILRGVGAAVALPFLDGMVPAFAPRALAAAAPAKRFGAIYVGMGMNMNVWLQPGEGELQMNPILAPLEPLRERMLVVAGLDSKQAFSADAGNHPRAQSSWLTGCRAKKTDGPDIQLGTSLDQIVAKEFARETQLGSLELTLDSADLAGNCAYGFSCAYNNTIAWRTPTTPLPMENNPRNVFERLFGASDSTDPAVRRRQLTMDASILDSVTGEVASFQKGLGPVDRRKVAEYLDAVRDVERRIQKAEEQSTKEMPLVTQPGGIPNSFEEHAKLMFDLQLLAFQTDLTRVFTYVMARESAIRSYPEIGVPDSHHPLSHHQNNPEKLAKLAKIQAFHMRQFAYFLDKLAKTRDGDGSLLDNTLILYGSGMSDSNMHTPENVPTLVVAGKGFGIHGNRFLKYPEATPLANLQLTLLDKIGLRTDHFGDSTGELSALTGV
jgi:hypothetical protein